MNSILVTPIVQELKFLIQEKYTNLDINFIRKVEPTFLVQGAVYEYLVINGIESTIRISETLVEDLIHFFGNDEKDIFTELIALVSYEIDNYLTEKKLNEPFSCVIVET